MREIKTNAFFLDEDYNLCLLFGNNYIGIDAGTMFDKEGKEPDIQYLKFEELQEPLCNGKGKKEDYKPRTDVRPVFLLFKNAESVNVVIDALQKIREHIK